MRVLALDPGERVGWARADVAEDGTWSELRHGITPLKDMALAVYRALETEPPDIEGDGLPAKLPEYDVLVVEDWRLRAEKAKSFVGSSFPAVQFIGMVRLCAWRSGCKLVMQGPALKTTADKTLARLWPEMYEKVTQSISHDDGHDLDAIRHLWVWTYQHTDLVKTRLQETA